jgi:hypothetical protein
LSASALIGANHFAYVASWSSHDGFAKMVVVCESPTATNNELMRMARSLTRRSCDYRRTGCRGAGSDPAFGEIRSCATETRGRGDSYARTSRGSIVGNAGTGMIVRGRDPSAKCGSGFSVRGIGVARIGGSSRTIGGAIGAAAARDFPAARPPVRDHRLRDHRRGHVTARLARARRRSPTPNRLPAPRPVHRDRRFDGRWGTEPEPVRSAEPLRSFAGVGASNTGSGGGAVTGFA